MNPLKRIFLTLIVLLVTVCCFAENLDPSNIDAMFFHLTMNEGLPSNTIRALSQDKKGFVWIGTSRGLCRHDGHKLYVIPNTRTLSVTSLCQRGDSICIGTENGLYFYSHRTDSVSKFVCRSKDLDVTSVDVYNVAIDKSGNLWISTMSSGILRIDRKCNVKRISTPDGGRQYGYVYVDGDDDVWACSNWTKDKLLRYDRKSDKFKACHLSFADGTPGDVPYGIVLVQDEKGSMWIASWNGSVVRFDKKTLKARLMLSPEESHMNHVHSVIQLLPGYFLFGSDTGLIMYDVARHKVRFHNRFSDPANTLSDDFVYPLMIDREGGTWIGTYYGGLNYTHAMLGNFSSYYHSPYFNSVTGSVVNTFCEDKSGRLWIASDDGGLCYFKGREFFPVKLMAGGKEQKNVHALCIDGNEMYVGTYAQGLDIMNLDTKEVVAHEPTFIGEDGKSFESSAMSIYKDSKGRVWVGSFKTVSIYDRQAHRFTNKINIGATVLSILEDRHGVMWFGTDGNGLWSWNDKTKELKQHIDFGQQLDLHASVFVNSVCEDSNGKLWVGTSFGLFYRDGKTGKFVKVDLQNENVMVFGIVQDSHCLWISTTMGVCCYSLEENAVVQVFKGGGSIVSTDFLQNAMYRSSSGQINVGTSNGFLSFNPSLMNYNSVVPKVVFTELDIFNHPVRVGSDILPQRLDYMDEITLSYRETVFRVGFSAMSYLHPSDNSYTYYLEGFDEDWIDAGNSTSVTYTNLSPGTYTLHVIATNNDGVKSEEATLRIVITPPFYWNTTAQIIYLLLIIAGIVLLIRRILKRKEKQFVAKIEEVNIQKEQAIQEIHIKKEQEIQEVHIQKEREIQEINVQKELQIQEINMQKEQEVHDARIKYLTISAKDNEFLDRLENVIENNFANSDLSVDFLASELNISRSGLFAKIKDLADVTPNEMIQIIRLKHAADLLRERQYRVNEVCFMVGFNSPSYFSKCFQKQFGVTPAKFK